MQAIKIEINGKQYDAKLGVDAITQVEAQYDHQSIPQLVTTRPGVNVFRSIVVAAIANEDPQLKVADLLKELKKEIEDGRGIEYIQEIGLELVTSSGLFGKNAAKKGKG